jgi:GntR family transcriptional regulator
MSVTELDPGDPRAYIRLAVLVRDRIASGDLKPGKAVPSITTYSQQYGHARQTCSKAFGLLIDDGLLFRVPGLGYYVTKGARERLNGD